MLPFIVAAQLLAADPTPGPSALQDLIARAADRNRAAPASLLEYRAQMESEIAVLLRRADGEESALSLEQSQNEVRWQRGGDFSQHMTGYRARQAGPSMSALAVLRKAWAIPMLYGNEFGVIFGGESKSRSSNKSAAAASTGNAVAVHPFGPDGQQVYDFDGGDTVAVIETQQRRIPVVRVRVEPRREQTIWPVVAFRGEIDLDADRGEIIRMRGQFVTLDQRGPQRKRLLILPVSVMAYVDLESVEVDGRYWLPRYQRIETHVDVGGLAEGRSVFRIVSRFRGHEVKSNEGSLQTVTAFGTIADGEDATYGTPRHRLTTARGDSLKRPRAWWTPLGDATAALRGDDFADVGAESSTPPSSPRLTWRAQRLAELVHFNRIEGLATGVTAQFTPGAVAPDVVVRANATWAWSEQAVRGRVEALRRGEKGEWRAGLRVGRTLDITNDFTAPRDSGGALFAPLVGVDDYDYVDRQSAMLWFDRSLIPRRATLRLELTTATDRGARARLTSGPLGGDVPFRPNRGVDEGSYVSSAMVAEWNPAVNGAALATGIGAMLRTEVAGGDLAWHRTTLRLNARADAGAMGYAVRVDGGILTNRGAPSQQLFELGGGPAFPGYEYKEFAGDRAMAAHVRALYRLPILRSPVRMFGCTCLTSPAPALAITLHGASLSTSSAATLESIARLGSVPDSTGVTLVPLGRGAPLSRPTHGVRSSLEVGLRFFGGAATVAVARPTDTGGPWRTIVLLGQSW
jgi:hypothetical protein